MFSRLMTEFSAHREEVKKRFDEGDVRMTAQDTLLVEIRDQTTKTNGRVTRLEDSKLDDRLKTLEEIKTKALGVWWVIGLLGGGAVLGVSIFEAIGIWIKG